MGYAVELFFEEPGATQLRELFQKTGSPLLSWGATPHISLAVIDEVDEASLIKITKKFASETQPFKTRFSSLGTFPGEKRVVFLAPIVTNQILDLHSRFHKLLEKAGLKSNPLYLPGQWVPHCTITEDQSSQDSLKSIETLTHFIPQNTFTISSVHIVKFRPVTQLTSFPLSTSPDNQ